jgi:GTP cyclohydrolase I
VAQPVADLAPQKRHPETGDTMQSIAEGTSDRDTLIPIDIAFGTTYRESARQATKELTPMPPLEVNPAHYDVFRDEMEDVEPQECYGNIECAVRNILVAIGEDPERQGLLDTPDRVSRMYEELTAGYHVDPEKLVNEAIFDVDYDEMVVVRNIDFYSLCEHHMLPFMGQAHVGYIPSGHVIGLSKIPRVVEMFARRLQIQEQMTVQIAEFLNSVLHPQGVGVVVEGMHMCAAMRGVKKSNARMVTSAMLGSFKRSQNTRNEFLSNIGRRNVDHKA